MYFIFSKYNKFSHFHSRFSRIWFQPIFPQIFVVVQLLNQVQLFSAPWTAAHKASLSFITSQSLLKLMFIESVMPSNHLVPCVPSSSAFNLFQHQGFSHELALPIRWPKHWNFSFSINPSNEYSGLISFRIDWFDLLAVQGTLKSLLQHHSSKASILWHCLI